VYAAALAALAIGVAIGLVLVGRPSEVALVVSLLAFAGLPVAVGIAILRYRLYHGVAVAVTVGGAPLNQLLLTLNRLCGNGASSSRHGGGRVCAALGLPWWAGRPLGE
jgi:hypothetical protein